jgi:hypothetical protein
VIGEVMLVVALVVVLVVVFVVVVVMRYYPSSWSSLLGLSWGDLYYSSPPPRSAFSVSRGKKIEKQTCVIGEVSIRSTRYVHMIL